MAMISAMTSCATSKKHILHLQTLLTTFFVLISCLPSVTCEEQTRYEPVDNIAIDCGSSENTTSLDPRSWFGDVESKYFRTEGLNQRSVALEAVDQPIIVDKVPYRTARLSRFEFTYKIPVTPGPKFIRLYFYSANSYRDYNLSTAFFSVKVGPYTLLNNFSVPLTADALGGLEGIKREFCITAVQSILNITFAPNSSIPGSFAFVNGIEVVSMPSDLYYSDEVKLVAQQGVYPLENNTAVETMYRINIGGNAISPADDTGMFRQWEKDDSYVKAAGTSVFPVIDTNSSLHFKSNLSSYAAPANVYKTGRSMGYINTNKKLIRSYRLTWDFSVDSGFSYMLRLHFCEIETAFSKIGDRVFDIYIANETAAENFDIIMYSGGQFIPYYRDFGVLKLGEKSQKKINLSIALQANLNDASSAFVDAILNGLEIFKLNETTGNLAGPNPDPTPRATNVPPSIQPSKEKSNRTTIIAIVSGVLSGVILLFVLGLFFFLRRARKVKGSTSTAGTTWWGPISFTTTKSSKTRASSSLPSDLCRFFSLAEIRAATNNFEGIFIIGVGGFGNVYKGYIDNGSTAVAIKRLKSESSQGAHEFKTEIEMLSHLRHRHLVSLIGYCNEDREMILVYDYMARGTLRSHLYSTDNPPLTWKQRLEICMGAARGLHYLHTGAKYTIIHRDVKTTNILLDEKWVAKVSDFGLSKMGPTTMSKAHVSTVVKGSFGYLDPEYYRRQQLSEKSDVYSFGVVLCEVLCGRPPIIRNAEKKQVSLAEWARSCYHNGTLHQIIDPNLTGKIAPECLKKYGEIAVNCMHDNGTERPSMNDVVWGLEFAMQLQQNAEDNDRIGVAIMEAKGEDEVAFLNNKNSNNSDGTFTCSWEGSLVLKSSGMTKISSSTNETTKETSGSVFSEINDPKGR